MVKSNAPLQIRLTEPVVFLRGPSTGLNFRGRPQAVRQDGQPAMLRGLLTLRLSKPTRIREISIKLTGKARTEWPEGIGSKRMDTSEEHVIMSQSTTYFSSQDESSRSRSVRRAASLGPGVLFSQPNSDDEELDDDLELHGVPREGGDVDDWVGVSRRGRENMMRSASALPASHDGTAWHRDGFSRRPSFSDELDPLSGDGQAELDNLAVRGRGPSPAYTSTAPVPPAELRRSSLRQSYSPMPSRAPGVSPIASAPSSPRAHDRDDSTETERRLASRRSSLAFRHGLLDEGGDGADLEHRAPTRARDESALDDEEPTPTRPILSTAGHRVGSGEVRFAHTVRNGAGTIEPGESHSETPGAIPRTNRAASVRTMDSSVSDSSSSLTSSSQEPSPGDTHPIGTVVQPISVVSTAVNSPAPSASPSIRTRHSTETVPMTSLSSPPTRRSTLPDSDQSVPSPGSGLSRQSRRLSNNPAVPARSQASSVEPIEDRSEVRQGRVSRTGNASTIVTAPDAEAGPSSRTSMNSTRSQNPSATARSASGASMGSQRSGQLPQSGPRPTGEPSEDGRGRDKSKFSISAALRGLSKGRLSSKSRTREDKSRTPSFNEPRPPMPSVSVGTAQSGSGSAVPQRLVEGERTGRPVRGTSFGQVGDFVPPYGQGGAGDQIRSKGRTASPVGMRDEREESRGRGRNKGMKVLTGALGFGATHEEEDDDVHNWKEFRKGTYSYPISFPIPVDAPPTIHAEFGSVSYRLKATVVRVGALSPNLVEDTEVYMIASPQEDDMEESENVLVERQWEEQMRYQIALSGKAFPIGGSIPITIRLMPLMKCKIHRLVIGLEEKNDYYAQDKKVARHEVPKKFLLLFIKQTEKLDRVPLLPILSDDPNAARESPLAPLALQAALSNPTADSFDVDGHDDNMYATLFDPMGPWHLEQNLSVPDCTSMIHFSTKHEKTNITIAHWLKVTIRVERGDDEAMDARGRRKQFDIIIDTPIKILDCRVNPQWNSLPTYTPNNPGSTSTNPNVCLVHANKHAAPLLPLHRASVQAADPLVTSSTSPVRTVGMPPFDPREASTSRSRDRRASEAVPKDGRGEGEDSLLERNIIYNRLMSGQVTETGEVPPSYGEAVASAVRARSASRPGRGGQDGREGREGREESGSRSRSRLRQSILA